jgi:hypothetical protein
MNIFNFGLSRRVLTVQINLNRLNAFEKMDSDSAELVAA